MRSKHLVMALVAAAGLCACSSNNELGKERIRQFSTVEKMFAEPGKDYRPAPLWTWNEKVNHDDIDRMLKDFKDEGYGGAFIHPRAGLITEYLSDDWFELWRYSVEKGKQLGLDIWIYDENSYPSGFAGGHVQREMPQSYDHPTFYTMQVIGPEAKCVADEHSFIVEMEGQKYMFTEGFAKADRWTGGKPYVDILYPGVTEKFIELTMTGYEKEFGAELGPVVKGIFTDEPHPHQFTPAMFDEFRKDWGYDLKENFPCMFAQVGNWKQVRFHYWSTMLRLFIQNWSKPWDRYCLEHGLLWTGHYWEHIWPGLNDGWDNMAMDNMAMYQYHHLPAIDMLFNGFDESSPYAQWGNIRSVKELRSVANQMGYTRTLCESYGGGGWAMTFENFKRLADWEYALGVNFMNQHYSNVTTEGARKFDYPDYFTGYAPWAEDYKSLNDHVARLSLVLSQGDQDNEILVIEPTSTAWMYYGNADVLPEIDRIGYSFTELVSRLEHSQVEFDLASETIISNCGKVRDDDFVIGEREYSIVIIPENTEVLLPRTAELLCKYAERGGKIVALSQPGMVNAYADEGLQALWQKGLKNISFTLDEDVFDNDDISFDKVCGGDLHHHRREYKDGDLLFLANSSPSEAVSGRITMEGCGLKELDTMTGEVYLYPSSRDDDDEISFSFEIPAAGQLLLFAPDNAKSLAGLQPRTIRRASDNCIAPVTPMAVKRLSDNYLTLDYCRMSAEGEDLGESFVADACQSLYRHFGMENPWETAVQYKQEAVQADTLTRGNIDIEYQFEVVEEFDFSSLKLVCERPWLWNVSINGTLIAPIEGVHPLDARNGAYSVGEYVQKGNNVVRLHLDRMSIFAEVAHAFISGDFSVVPNGGKWALAAPRTLRAGNWPDQGMPFYGWGVSYSAEYDISNSAKGHILKLGKWEGTVCEVWVNSKKVGLIAYEPFEFDLSPYLSVGRNQVEVRCIGSLVNLYGPHFVPRGAQGPGSWYGTNTKHPCSDYILNHYGLHEPFEITSNN